MNAYLVARFCPDPSGHGGEHRTYQLAESLRHVFGSENTQIFTRAEFAERSLAAYSVQRGKDKRGAKTAAEAAAPCPYPSLRYLSFLRLFRHRPRSFIRWLVLVLGARSVMRGRWTVGRASPVGFAEHYRRVVQDKAEPAVCFLEDVGLASVWPVNKALGIRTVACPQNIEALDMVCHRFAGNWEIAHSALLDFMDELSFLGNCEARLFISRVEAGLVGGFGLPSQYCPYVPTGQLFDRLWRIRAVRSTMRPERLLFLLLGTAGHGSTRRALSSFLSGVVSKGLPEGARLIVAGGGTETLAGDFGGGSAVEFRGWLGVTELDSLLTRVTGALVPHPLGFGALTRVSELCCAGVPVAVSRHATHALDLPPGALTVDDTLQSWRTSLERMGQGYTGISGPEYQRWQQEQSDEVVHIMTSIRDVPAVGVPRIVTP